MFSMVDSYRFLMVSPNVSCGTGRAFREVRPTPWTPIAKSLAQCTIALVSSAALALNGDRPFDLQIERIDPWFSDPSYRVLPRDTATGEVQVSHLHINPAFAKQDLNCMMPLERLAELVYLGEVGGSAPSHYSYIGYTLRPERLLHETVPTIIAQMQRERVDAVVLVPV
jgi:D-proline reductase (dithiol) PrdB